MYNFVSSIKKEKEVMAINMAIFMVEGIAVLSDLPPAAVKPQKSYWRDNVNMPDKSSSPLRFLSKPEVSMSVKWMSEDMKVLKITSFSQFSSLLQYQ